MNVVVTGAGRGLGYRIALRHVERGDQVHAFAHSPTEELSRLAEKGDRLKMRACDIASTESVEAATKDAVEAGRKVDILYNVAAVFRFEDRVGLAETDLDAFVSMYDVNAVGALRMCKALWPLIAAGTVIVNVSSEAGSIGACRRGKEYAYCMSKAALNMGSKILSNELAGKSVRVLCIHPGWLKTAMGGPEALASDDSISPELSAERIVDIALNADRIPKEQMYMEHTRNPLPW